MLVFRELDDKEWTTLSFALDAKEVQFGRTFYDIMCKFGTRYCVVPSFGLNRPFSAGGEGQQGFALRVGVRAHVQHNYATS